MYVAEEIGLKQTTQKQSKYEEELPEWQTFGRTILCLKDQGKGNAVDNFRPISCLPLMWKLIADVMYKHLEGILPGAEEV